MRIERIFTTPEGPDSARVKLASYLEQIGYRPVSGGDVLTFERVSAGDSMTGSPPQSTRSRTAVEVRTGYDQRTWVFAVTAIDLGAFASKDPSPWQQEMDGLVSIVGGTVADMSTTALQALAPAFALRQAPQQSARLQVDARVNSAVSWLYAIASFSVVNTILLRLGLDFGFLVGLAATLFVEELATAWSRRMPESAGLFMIVALLAEACIAGIFLVLAILAQNGLRWALIVGMVLYAIDGVAWLLVKGYIAAAFHAAALLFIFNGLRALGRKQAPPNGHIKVLQ
jgi:hypothetical protein